MLLIIMGVTGCGKTTLGQALASRTGLPFYDADDFHPEANREKLRQDIALTDQDRLPWLKALHQHLLLWEKEGGAILACSALKQAYRDILSGNNALAIQWVYLQADKDLIITRLNNRAKEGHPLVCQYDQIVAGQFGDLEEPKEALVLNAVNTVEENVEKVIF